MSADFPASWTDPDYVATVTAVLAAGAVVAVAAVTPGAPTPETVSLVLLSVFGPAALAHALASHLQA